MNRKEIIDYYLFKKSDNLLSHIKNCIERIIKIQYKGYLRDIEVISKIQKSITERFKQLTRYERQKMGVEMYRIERRIDNFKAYEPFNFLY